MDRGQNKERRKNPSNRATNISMKASYVILIFLVVYFLLRSVPSFITSSIHTTEVLRENFTDFQAAEAIVVKEEKVYKTDTEGKIKRYIEEGQRAPGGEKIASIITSEEDIDIESEISELEDSILELEEIEENIGVMSSEDALIDSINQTEYELQKLIKEKDLKQLYFQKERLRYLRELKLGNEITGNTLEKLKKRKESLTKKLDQNVRDFYIDEAGIVTYNTRNISNIKIEDLKKLNYNDVNIKSNNNPEEIDLKENVETNEEIFKIVDNFVWYLVIKSNDYKDIEELKDQNKIKVKIDDEEEIITGRVINFSKSGNNALIILEFRDSFSNYYQGDIVDIKIIKTDIEGYKIPKETVIFNEGISGVYIIDDSGIVRFRAIDKIGEDENYMYTRMGDHVGNIQIDDKHMITITRFDEIILNPRKVYDGMIVD